MCPLVPLFPELTDAFFTPHSSIDLSPYEINITLPFPYDEIPAFVCVYPLANIAPASAVCNDRLLDLASLPELDMMLTYLTFPDHSAPPFTDWNNNVPTLIAFDEPDAISPPFYLLPVLMRPEDTVTAQP